MDRATTLTPYRVRVRYAECDAFGELQLAHVVSYFDCAVADTFKQLGIDWHQLTHPAGPLRVAGVHFDVHRSPGYDVELDMRVLGIERIRQAWQISVAAFARGQLEPVVGGEMVVGRRCNADGSITAIPGEVEQVFRTLGM